jgi:DNA polymerase I-like protein with 3'-5' exonuclease and polymerase domains
MKYYAILLDQNLQKYGDAVAFVGNIHDEIQLEVRNDIVDEVKGICEHTFSSITTQLKWRLPLEGEAKSGLTWMDTH